MALGAAPLVMFRMVTRHAAMLATVGVVLGVVGALVFARALSGVLYGVVATDLMVLLAGAAVVFLAVLGAACRPAWQATRVDPMQILRAD